MQYILYSFIHSFIVQFSFYCFEKNYLWSMLVSSFCSNNVQPIRPSVWRPSCTRRRSDRGARWRSCSGSSPRARRNGAPNASSWCRRWTALRRVWWRCSTRTTRRRARSWRSLPRPRASASEYIVDCSNNVHSEPDTSQIQFRCSVSLLSYDFPCNYNVKYMSIPFTFSFFC